MALDEHQRLALIPDVIAGRHHIGAGIEQLGQDLFGNAETPGGVLTIDDDEVGEVLLSEEGRRESD